MITDAEIRKLITVRKKITKKSPTKGYNSKQDIQVCKLYLQSTAAKKMSFFIFIRQNIEFRENFSIGLNYLRGNNILGDRNIPLIRYNGPHGEKVTRDGHYNKTHIHHITPKEIESGSIKPKPKHIEITDKYNTFDQALSVFFEDMKIINYSKYLLNLKQRTIFDEYSENN